jgi:hypothetical protein
VKLLPAHHGENELLGEVRRHVTHWPKFARHGWLIVWLNGLFPQTTLRNMHVLYKSPNWAQDWIGSLSQNRWIHSELWSEPTNSKETNNLLVNCFDDKPPTGKERTSKRGELSKPK